MPAFSDPLPTLDDLGPRIMIIGPSGSGKSTLAVALANKLEYPVCHLDIIHQQPGTDWKPRPPRVFEALHKGAVLQENWIIEGNYSRLMWQRFERASAIIWLTLPIHVCLFRYFKRALFKSNRQGRLPGASEKVNWYMLHHIAIHQPSRVANLRKLVNESGLPVVALNSVKQISNAYAQWQLSR